MGTEKEEKKHARNRGKRAPPPLPTRYPWEHEVVHRFAYSTPRTALVYKAWTEPHHMSQWFGPKNWTNPVCELDVKPGGAWRIVMRAPNGGDYPCGGVYREIVRAQRLVFTNNALEHRRQTSCSKA